MRVVFGIAFQGWRLEPALGCWDGRFKASWNTELVKKKRTLWVRDCKKPWQVADFPFKNKKLFMPVTRLNFFTAKAEQREALARFLSEVIQVVINAEGCLSCRLLCDYANPFEFVILETWESVEAHQQAAGLIPKEQIMSVMQYLEKPPRGEYLVAKTN
jgi:quinol monooxygenase YgiN